MHISSLRLVTARKFVADGGAREGVLLVRAWSASRLKHERTHGA
jgi:hypothetical protein